MIETCALEVNRGAHSALVNSREMRTLPHELVHILHGGITARIEEALHALLLFEPRPIILTLILLV
jgi:Zn-dependent oligopeptidase